MRERDTKAERKVKKALVQLMLNQPFFATGLLNLDIQEDPSCQTAYVTPNGKLGYNPAFIEKLSEGQVQFLLCHELMHVLFLHLLRRGGREQGKWNLSCDIVIDTMLQAEKFEVILPPDRGLGIDAVGKTAEEVYKMLQSEDDKGDEGKDGSGGGEDDEEKESDSGNGGEKEDKEGEEKDSDGSGGNEEDEGKETEESQEKDGGDGKEDKEGEDEEGKKGKEGKGKSGEDEDNEGEENKGEEKSNDGDSEDNGGSEGDEGKDKEDSEEGKGKGKKKEESKGEKSFDEHREERCDAQTQKELEQRWQSVLVQSLNTARQQGKLPGSLAEIVEELLYPPVPWRILLSQFVQRNRKADYSWIHPNRRYISQGIYLPGYHEQYLKLVVAIDSSGSIATEELQLFVGALKDILESVKTEITLLICDEQIQLVKENINIEEIQKIEIKGRGGTDFRPVFEYIEKNNPDVDCLLYLTDGAGDFPMQAPSYPVLWCLVEECEVPFGEKILIKGDERC